jgi:Predicted membrane protein
MSERRNIVIGGKIRSYLIFTVGLYFLSLGIVLIVRSALGTTPISSINYVMSLGTPLTLGMWTAITNGVMMLAQFLLLKKDRPDLRRCRIEVLLQIPFTLVFSAFIDLNMIATASLVPANYIACLAILAAGCLVQSAGVVLELKGRVAMMSAEGLVARIAERIDKPFGNVKVVFDVALIVLASVVSLMLFGSIQGVREGSVISAVCTGFVVKFLANSVMTRANLDRIRKALHIKWYI